MRLYERHIIPDNWALEAFGSNRILEALKYAEFQILSESMEQVFVLEKTLSDDEMTLIQEAAYMCEIAALEWWQAAKFPDDTNIAEVIKFKQVCSLAFSLLMAVPLPNSDGDKFTHVLRILALGYLADRATDVKRWIAEKGHSQLKISISGWDGQLISSLLDIWVRLVRRENWEDVHKIAESVSWLRSEQKTKEAPFLKSLQKSVAAAGAWQLVACYHWAKATEELAEYMLVGKPGDIAQVLDFHFEKAFTASEKAGSLEMGNLIHWLHLASQRMVYNSVWSVAQRFNSNITKYITQIVKQQAILELLPPQRVAIFEDGLLDRTHNAVVVSLPTSSGKTNLAIFRILEAYNHFGGQKSWIAYTAPTRALVNQVANRLRRELSSLGIKIQTLSGAMEIDQIEEEILKDEAAFDVLVCTPEKLDTVMRQRKIQRELVLYIMDEAHNIEQETRGFKHELLLAMIKRDCPGTKFLLLTPYVSNGMEIARWLDPQAPGEVAIKLDWQPNERIIGKFYAEPGSDKRNWTMRFKSMASTHPSLGLDEIVNVGEPGPLPETYNKVKNNLTALACAMSVSLRQRGCVLVITQKKPNTWTAARRVKEVLPEVEPSPEVELVIKFLQAEFGAGYELIDLLKHGIAVHHAGLSDEVRYLIEWLVEENHIKVLCATTTIAQGINFPVSSIIIASIKYPYGVPLKFREFWNLAGRAGRLGQPGVGLIGIASKENGVTADEDIIAGYLQEAHSELLSSLLEMFNKAKEGARELNLQHLADDPAWSAFLQYLAHLYKQSDRDRLLGTQLELTLRDTLGYVTLEKKNPAAAKELVGAVRKYVDYLNQYPENATLAENTGFAPENAYRAMIRVQDEKIDSDNWKPEVLFGGSNSTLRNLMGVMLHVPELSNLNEIASSGFDNRRLGDLTTDWVNGQGLRQLAIKYFSGEDVTALTKCCDAIYSKLINNATWGLASLQKLSGLDFENMPESERRQLNLVPAMIYYGVNSEEAVIMRMNHIPRSLAGSFGQAYQHQKIQNKMSSTDALQWLSQLDQAQWEQIRPQSYPLDGGECQAIWKRLNGIE